MGDNERLNQLKNRQNDILERLQAMADKVADMLPIQEITPIQKRIDDYATNISLKHEMARVPKTYYSWTLEKRAAYLKAPSIHNLCKSIIVENINCVNQNTDDPFNSRFYCIIIQYTTKLQNQKILKFVKGLSTDNSSLSKANYRFTMAQSEDSNRLTGFEYNAVCPIGTAVPIPIIISNKILELPNPIVWLGGGEVDLKLVVDINDFKQSTELNTGTKVFVADVVYDQQYNSNDANVTNNNNDEE
ncbi:hypothetical protein DFA_10053 [Cavenderia fasciculata]|uniref:YbaK/aminoacyl-tRNA synthetase-associated domain-containing protein n=1 Tax=Cavenderia fasciculata TaxID=261658 RepID=F4Q954_CACFS|nr:uncharacterized protein DFA_10053 [Cavenderia fasciculata]EGG15223.1 hypothetical protein DFA_10053 [Cavenderia fasciculata]|eukprot:XP_004351943.1 hypothetical protein DFA_10053 [Cavenderia fasciculata]